MDKYVLEIEPMEEEKYGSDFHVVKRRPLVPDDWTEHLSKNLFILTYIYIIQFSVYILLYLKFIIYLRG